MSIMAREENFMLSSNTTSSDINIHLLNYIVNEEEVKVREISVHTTHLSDDNSSDIEPEGKIWTRFYEENCFARMTHFTRTEILDIWREMMVFGLKSKKRGRKSAISDMDALLAYLVLIKTGIDYDTLAALFKVHVSSLIRAFEKVAPILYDTLKNRWWGNKIRPRPLAGSNFPYIALCGDSTSIEVNRPKGRYEESKHYFDYKNGIYALNKECAVMATPPHYCVFSQKAVVGSVHDFNILKTTYDSYVEYLFKRTEEKNLISSDESNSSWAILFDSVYICSDENKTPGLRKIALLKGEIPPLQRNLQAELRRIRVVIEQFFGRLKSLWSIFRKPYRYSHEKFDMDFDICVLLTNEHIKSNFLQECDQIFHHNLHNIRRLQQESKDKKNREQVSKSRQRKRQRVNII